MRPLHASVAIALCILCSGAEAASPKACVYPEADYRENASHPTLDGEIVDAGKESMKVLVSGAKTPIEVAYPANTNLYTSAGSIVRPDQLELGTHVWIWLVDCRLHNTEPQQAARVEASYRIPGNEAGMRDNSLQGRRA